MIFLCIPVEDLAHRALGMGSGCIMRQPDEHAIVIRIVCAHHRAVNGCFLANNEVGAGRSCSGYR